MNPEFSMVVSLCISLLSFVVFVMLLYSYMKDKDKNYSVHSLTRLLAALTFFLFINGAYDTVFYASTLNLLHANVFLIMSSTYMDLLPNIGIFLCAVLVVHFIMSNKIEDFKTKEVSLGKLERLNKELEVKAKCLEGNQTTLERKVHDLERFTEIAKARESEMILLIQKIELLEKKLKVKK